MNQEESRTGQEYSRSDCRGQKLCGRWRTCERCARARQKLWADRAQILESKFGGLCLARCSPEENTERAMKALRDRIMRARLAPAGIWSIETGSLYAGLHLNIIAPEDSDLRASGMADYIEPIRTTARTVAAYITKRGGMPSAEQYSGRLAGSWGSFTQALFAGKTPEATRAQAALLDHTLRSPIEQAEREAGWFRVLGGYVKGEPEQKVRTREEYAEIARRNLSKLYASMASKCQNITTV